MSTIIVLGTVCRIPQTSHQNHSGIVHSAWQKVRVELVDSWALLDAFETRNYKPRSLLLFAHFFGYENNFSNPFFELQE